ncbi:MAG: aldehyde dehydrogenase family protein [Actinobacteria bacterium]|nr:aldehyde dehydrogenase family protein [Actinomycetota bacterium]
MTDHHQFYIDGKWVDSVGADTLDVIDPATTDVIASIALGESSDVDRAVTAARGAFETFSRTSREERLTLLDRLIAAYRDHAEELAQAVSREMGAPITFARKAQVPAGLRHLEAARAVLAEFDFEESLGTTAVTYEAIGVCAMITPWNWPLNQIAAKVGPALAAGCTMVLKPSEIAPLSGLLFARIAADAGVPPGVFNVVNGDGPTVGAVLACHEDVDMVSFTGSTLAGVEVARNAAPTVKRVAQELGGKSANVLLDDIDFESVVTRDVLAVYTNSGQSCNAGTRMIVPRGRLADVVEIARAATDTVVVGAPADVATTMGPVVSAAQFARVQGLIETGIREGGSVVVGGLGSPPGRSRGYFVKPTVFSDVTNAMTIAREEIFGPVLVIIAYDDEDEAVSIANDTVYGLGGFVSSSDLDRARAIARRLRTGMVHINGAPLATDAPFGGFKRSGNGREFGKHGLQEFLEAKSLFGYRSA